MKISLIIFFAFTISIRLNAQINSSFINHLVFSDLNHEHLTYLNSLRLNYGPSDSLNYYMAKYYLLQEDYVSFEKELINCKVCFKDSSLLNYSTSHIVKQSIFSVEKIWEIDETYGNSLTKSSMLKKSYDLIKDNKLKANFLPYELEVHFNEYKLVERKKAWVAAGLSIVIPGSGKLYIGRPNSFFGSLVSNVIYGIIAYESVNKLGIKNPYSIVSSSAFGVFYLSNIIGVVHDLKRIKTEKKKHFLYEAAIYQSSGIYLYE